MGISAPERSGATRVLARADLGKMEGYHSPQVNCSVRLNTNESPFPPPLAWQEQLADEVASLDFHRYPDRNYVALRTALAQLHRVEPNQIFVANGSNEVLQTLCLAFGGPGRVGFTFEPSYAMHSQIARVSGMAVRSFGRNETFDLTQEIVGSALETGKPDITFVCSPNNPTGNLIADEVLDFLVESVPGLIVVDEAYGQFAPNSALRHLDDRRNLVVVKTFSKTWAMAGQRLGYCIAPAWLIDQLSLVVLPYHLDSVKQAAGVLALRYEPQMRVRVEQLVAQRNFLIRELKTMPIHVFDSHANFILFKLPEDFAQGASCVWQKLVDRSVLVRNCDSWAGLAGCLRVTVGTPEENKTFLAALRDVLELGA